MWVRSGDWKLIRWFGVPTGDEPRYELYNLRDDLGESKNLAASAAGAREGTRRAHRRLSHRHRRDLSASEPRLQSNCLDQAKTNAVVNAADPLEGWKARQCEAVVKDGVLTMTGKGKAGAAFLGHAMGRTTGPVVIKLRVRGAAGGAGKIEWMGDSQAGAEPRSTPIAMAPGDWQELSVAVPADGLLGTTRLYLPAGDKPVELDWVEMRGKSPAKPQRWDFNSK